MNLQIASKQAEGLKSEINTIILREFWWAMVFKTLVLTIALFSRCFDRNKIHQIVASAFSQSSLTCSPPNKVPLPSFQVSTRQSGRPLSCLSLAGSSSSWSDLIQRFFTNLIDKDNDESNVSKITLPITDDAKTGEGNAGFGTVIRIAGRKYDAASSKPSSRNYTTRKDSQPSATITKEGLNGDYNHYRTAALQSTPDRAISILTTDVMESLRAT